MSAISNFKKRRDAVKAKKSESQKLEDNPKPDNEALALLAALLGCDEQDAIANATELVERRARFVDMDIRIDPAAGNDKTVIAEVTKDDNGNITDIKTDLEDSASSVNQAADSVETASSELASNADDITDATAELKQATAELKKPLAGHQSSPSKKRKTPKGSSKK